MKKILIFTATYNEADNIRHLITDINSFVPTADILVVDDNSPDRTGEILEEIKENNDTLDVVHRAGKLGLGSAHKLAMQYALHHEYDVLVTMDADFSHDPKYLPTLLELLNANDFAIGSRYTEGGKCDYPFDRILLSRTANILTRFLLGIKLKETTTSYRGFNANLLKEMDIESFKSEGYSFFVEVMNRVNKVSNKLAEFPIHFKDRRAGVSKISKNEIFKGVYTLFKLFFKRLIFLDNKAKNRKQNLTL